jgi:hypothetical protein
MQKMLRNFFLFIKKVDGGSQLCKLFEFLCWFLNSLWVLFINCGTLETFKICIFLKRSSNIRLTLSNQGKETNIQSQLNRKFNKPDRKQSKK